MNFVEPAWKDNSGGGLLQYDFAPPAAWNAARLGQEHASVLSALEGVSRGDEAVQAPGWLILARGLPAALREVLIAELRAGNALKGIGSSGWPGEGSIVVNVRDRFSVAKNACPPQVRWRAFSDPHYWREELSQTAGAVEYLIIA